MGSGNKERKKIAARHKLQEEAIQEVILGVAQESGKPDKEAYKYDKWRFPVNQLIKQRSLSVINQAVQQKKVRYSPSFFTCILHQLRFQSGGYWLLQGGMLFMALLLSAYLNKQGAEGSVSITACSLFIVFAGNICLSGVGRLFSWHMAELEQTLYLNLKQLVCIQMMVAGVIDFIALALIVILCGSRYDGGMGVYLLYLIVPFLWSDILYFHMLTAFRGGMRGYRQVSLGVICGIMAAFPALFEEAYHQAYLPMWGILAVLGAGTLVLEIRRLLGKIEGGAGLCLN